MMVISDARRDGIGGRCDSAATPFLGWKHHGQAVAPVSARKLAASLWRFADTAAGDGSVSWKCGLSFAPLGSQFCSSIPIPKSASEGATKWDYLDHFHSNVMLIKSAASQKLVNGGGQPRAKIRYCTRKMSEETASSMRTELCYVIKNLADVIKSERKVCKSMDKMNSYLVNDIAEAKSLARKFIRNLGKEKKAREEFEDVCYNLGKEIQGRKAQIGALRNQQRRIQEEVEEEMRIRQMGEVWKEEQAQKKLADAKFILEDKYAQINGLIAHLRAFFPTSNLHVPINDSTSIPGANSDMSGVETVTQANIDSSRTRDASQGSVSRVRRTYKPNKGCQKSEATEISSITLVQPKTKVSSTSKLQRVFPRNERACNTKTMLMDGSSNRSISSTNPHVVRAMKGYIERPWRIQRHGLAKNLLETKLGGQKMLLRNVLKGKT